MKIRRAEDERVRGAESGIPGLVQLFTFGFYAESPFENLDIRYTIYEIRNTISGPGFLGSRLTDSTRGMQL
jgi:hypothetical protein